MSLLEESQLQAVSDAINEVEKQTDAELVTVCPCEGFISKKRVGTNHFGRRWYITVMGLMRLRESGEQERLKNLKTKLN